MVRPVAAIAIASLIGIISLPSLAQQRQTPTPTRQGDYNSAITKFPDGSQAVLLSWFTKIRSGKLNCRSAPGVNQRVIKQFQANELLQADAGAKNSQEPIVRDSQGNPWLRVKIANNQGKTQGTCFVRANRQFIEPNSLE
ncbi:MULTISPECIES: SH3 domain-containing protein [unclassified Nodularia (in: cyanobacteria)]|uniref:SH3 domain-containing protein n=1 Tax=unclassified Nodularia (in: cyanobacteria) TaxID=2656917 RepID=UPI00187F4D4A|nr:MULTISPECIES: SH3 domain-containing protein [unclassified Nodularia (in: cyanobacteria)]MBE9201399.1 SH3 domain-containing protein [Nodularia sp. LEGE 06071]MCC2691517.1 SH3 domain-containing protein [Nodularia sp. LEGE 04288]